ncbi:MAG: MGMT family protein [Pseudomonadota bacterium]|nr:MGMT family protein [Pseudomonadota bacterium]
MSKPTPTDAAASRQEARHSIIQVVGAIPMGRVCTYGRVAERAGLPGYARYVGTVLKQLPANSSLPWHRVINGQGKISFLVGSDQWQLQKQKLEQEGVEFCGERVSLRQYLW